MVEQLGRSMRELQGPSDDTSERSGMGRSFKAAILVCIVAAVAACAPTPKPRPPAMPSGVALPTEAPASGPALRPVTVLSGLSVPTNVEFAQNGRVWIAEHRGRILTFDSVDDATPTLTIDLSKDVRTWGDHGLLGMAIDPAFPARPFLYVQYSTDSTGRWGDGCPTAYTDGCVSGARLERLTLTPEGVATGQRLTLVDNRWCYQFSSHAIGDLKFLPDGSLLSSSGEGSSWSDTDYGQFGNTFPIGPTTKVNACGDPPGAVGVRGRVPTSEGGSLRSQDVLTPGDPTGWNGAIVRLDPDTGAPAAGNALQGGATPDDDAVVAHGLRNPYRFTVDPVSGDVLTVDVGWTAYEEVDRFNVGAGFVPNFGWPCKEGPYDQSAWAALKMNMCALVTSPSAPTRLTQPMLSYWHNHGGAALSGIAVVRPGRYPSSMDGDLMLADYVAGRVFDVKRHADGTAEPTDTTVAAEGVTAVDLQQAPDGYLYAVDLISGTLDRLVDAATFPVARLRASAVDGQLPLAVTFDARSSVDPTSRGLTYQWDLDGDGQYDDDTAAVTTRTYTSAANVTVGLRVVTDQGVDSTDSMRIFPGNRPPAVAVSVASPLPWVAHEQIEFAIDASDPDEGVLAASALSWTTELQHCETLDDCHLHPVSSATASAGGTVEGPSHEYPSFLKLTATATDARGETTTVTRRLDPAVVRLTVASSPGTASIAVGSESITTPVTIEMIKGSDIVVSAASPQQIGSYSYVFQRWSDGGARSHSIVVGNDMTIVAQFALGG
jgi:glucose/arabinose dehydrogenase